MGQTECGAEFNPPDRFGYGGKGLNIPKPRLWHLFSHIDWQNYVTIALVHNEDIRCAEHNNRLLSPYGC